MNVLAHQMRNLDGFDPSAYLLEQIEGPRMFTYYYPLKDHTAGEGLRMVRAIDARIEADTHSSRIIVVKLPVDIDPQIRLSITDEIARSLEGWDERYSLDGALGGNIYLTIVYEPKESDTKYYLYRIKLR